jgi:uncharacterized membrane protein YfcA
MLTAFGAGGAVGIIGGLIGLGGAEFRLPLLIGWFHFAALEAIILNKAISLVVVTSALPLRAGAVPLPSVASHWPIVLNLLGGSLIGAWVGAGWATRLGPAGLHRAIACILVSLSLVLLLGHDVTAGASPLQGMSRGIVGAVAGFGIGVVAALIGVAGGELLIPTLVLLFGADIKLAGSLSLAVSLPTMLTGFARYSRDRSFAVLGRNRVFMIAMAAGSFAGAWFGGQLLGGVPGRWLTPLLAAILLVSAAKLWRHP